MNSGTGTGIRTPVLWLRNAAGDTGGLRLRRFSSDIRTDAWAVSVGDGPFRAQSVSSFFQVVATASDATHDLDGTRSNSVECCEDFRNEGNEILHTIGRGSDDHDPKRQNRHILLALKVSIDRHEGIDQAACSLQQGAVLRSVPAQTLHGRNGVANQRVDQVVRKVLVKQYAHVSEGFRARSQGLRWPVRVEPTETA